MATPTSVQELIQRFERNIDAYRSGQYTVRTINFSDPADKSRHDRMVALVEQMLELHK
jgi:hypothetical protein